MSDRISKEEIRGMVEGREALFSEELTLEQEDIIRTVKALANDLLEVIERVPFQSRELSLAITKLEECVMWAVKGIEK